MLIVLAVTRSNALDFSDPPQGVFIEEWYELKLGDLKIGYGQSTLSREGDLIVSRAKLRMRMNRGFLSLSINSDLSNIETLSGDALSFGMETMMSNIEPVRVTGMVDDGKMHITRSQLGSASREEHPWAKENLMLWGTILTMKEQGLTMGTKYTLPVYSPDISTSGAVDATVEVLGEDTYLHKDEEITAIKTTQTMLIGELGTPLQSTIWINPETFLPVRTLMTIGGFDVDMYACTEEQALEDFVPPDIFGYSLINVEETILDEAKGIICRLDFSPKLEKEHTFPDLPNQRVLESTVKSARLAIRPEPGESDLQVAEAIYKARLPDEVKPFLKPNTYINNEDSSVRSLVAHLGKKDPDFAETAIAYAHALELQQLVSKHISDKSLSVGFATASEAARSKAGDCTEHAVLLAAVARVQQIPSRVVAGLVYLPEYDGTENIFGFHMWTQLYIQGKWRDFDAALPQYQNAPYRIALVESSLDGDSLTDISLGIMDMIGQLDITVEEVK